MGYQFLFHMAVSHMVNIYKDFKFCSVKSKALNEFQNCKGKIIFVSTQK